MGIAHVPEGRRVFATLTVLQNLKMGAYTRKDKNEMEETLKMIYKRFPRLEERKNQLAGTLSGGEQQMLAMGRALMSHPRLIVLDEPSMGLSPIYVNEIFDIIQKINEDGTTVLLVEQNAKKALSIADKAYVLETGTIALSGDAKELMNNDQVKKGGVMASSYVGGLSGAFIPVSEDQGMIDAVSLGALTIEKLEAMTCVCSVGLDMIAIPGDTPASTIAGIIADEAAIGMVNQKTTAVRLIPVIGKKVGDTAEFGGLLGYAPIIPVNTFSCEKFVTRGGRIPAPIHSFKN